MIIALLSSSSGSRGGGELYLYNLASGLSQLGHRVHTICSADSTMDALAGKLAQVSQITRVDLKNTYRRLTRCLGAILDLEQRRRVRRLLMELNPEVIHVNQQVAEDGLDLLLAARDSGLPFVSTIHIAHSASFLSARLGRLRDAITTAVLKNINATFITVANSARRDLVARLGASTGPRIHVVWNGVFFPDETGPEARHSTRARWGVTPGEFVLGSVGRLDAQKAPCFALEIISKLRQKGHAVRYIWIGDGEMRRVF